MNRYRHEYKYLVDACTESILRIRAAGVMFPDSHVGPDGAYQIQSLYFDDLYDSCMQENLSGTDPRSKFRIRYYNRDPSRLKLEKKIKRNGMTLKKSCAITEAECLCFLQGQYPPIRPDMDMGKQCLLEEMRARGLYPKVIVSYERIPFIYPGGNVRVTFDRKIASSKDLEHFLSGDFETRPILPLGQSVMEVKWDEVMPHYIKQALSLDTLQWGPFSKYYLCRLYHL